MECRSLLTAELVIQFLLCFCEKPELPLLFQRSG